MTTTKFYRRSISHHQCLRGIPCWQWYLRCPQRSIICTEILLLETFPQGWCYTRAYAQKSKPERNKPGELAFLTFAILLSQYHCSFLAHTLMLLCDPVSLRDPYSVALEKPLHWASVLSSWCSDCPGVLRRPVIRNIRMASCWFRFAYLLWPSEVSILIFLTHL